MTFYDALPFWAIFREYYLYAIILRLRSIIACATVPPLMQFARNSKGSILPSFPSMFVNMLITGQPVEKHVPANRAAGFQGG